MNFSMAIKRLTLGKAVKTLDMAGYAYITENEQSSPDSENIYRLHFKNRNGDDVCDYDATKDMILSHTDTPEADLSLDPELFNLILTGDWIVVDLAEAESQRTNPGIW